LQNRDLFTREIEFVGRAPRETRFAYRCYTLNRSIGNATLEQQKNRVHIRATDLPPARAEPLTGAPAYYTCTVLQCVRDTDWTFASRRSSPIRVSGNTGKDGPWSIVAAMAYQRLEDYSEVTSTVRKLAAEITAGCVTPLEKARAIHKHMIGFTEEVRRRPRPERDVEFIRRITDIVQFRKNPSLFITPDEGLHLAYALYKAAGFECRGVLLPNREKSPFSPQIVAASLMPVRAIALKIDDRWHYSLPHLKPVLPFDSVPWYCESLLALAIKSGPQEMFDAPASKSANARIINTATLTLDADGTLHGEVKRRYFGHHATELRDKLTQRSVKNPLKALQKRIEPEFEDSAAENESTATAEIETDEESDPPELENSPRRVVVTALTGLDDPEVPLEAIFTLRLPGFSQLAGERVLLRPSVFRTLDKHPFTAATRTHPIRYPFPWQEIDIIALTYPEGYAPESLDMPSLPPSPTIVYRNKLTDDPATHSLKLRREYAHEVNFVPTESYAHYKLWHDNIQHADQTQLVLVKKPAATVAATPTVPATSAP
jgi:hypothetical protein